MNREEQIKTILAHIEAAKEGIEALDRGRVGLSLVVATAELRSAAARVQGQSEEP
jgi:hypothetical protein